MPPASGTPEVSVLVTTHDRPAMLRDLLRSLEEQTCDRSRFEVVVCDAASAEATSAVVEEAKLRDRVDLRYLRVPTIRANPARNAGLRAARGPIVGLLDDDEIVAPDWVERGLEVLGRHPELDAVAGACRPYGETKSRFCDGCRNTPMLGVFDEPLPDGADVRPALFIRGGNSFVRRAAFDRHGMFNEAIVGLGDESEWCRRAVAGGARFAYTPAIWIYHRRDGATGHGLLWRRFRTYASLAEVERRWGRWPYAPRRNPLRRLAWLGHALRRRCWGGVLHFANGFFDSRLGHRASHAIFYKRLLQ